MASLMLPVVCASGTAAALKLQPLDEENAGEPIGLRAWDGDGAVRLLGDAMLGPVVSCTQWSLVLGYEGINQAIEISNDTMYGLAPSSACAFHLSVVDAIVPGVVWVSHHKHD
jgi:streptomycin 6-kinase